MSFEPLDPTRAEVRITGEAPNYGLDFYIPRGERGAVGPVGPMGPAVPTQLAIGEVVTGPETPGTVGPQGPIGLTGAPGGFTTGTDLLNQDLDIILTPGLYRQGNSAYSIAANHYPIDGANGTGILEVIQQAPGASGGTLQIYYTVWGNRDGRVQYQRTKINGGTFGPWRAIGYSRVDQAAGRAIYTWDDVNAREQRIYGDTGWRDVAANLINGATATIFHIKRLNDMIYLKISGLQLPTTSTNDPFYTVPTGFVGDSQYGILRETVNTGNGFGFTMAGNVQLYGTLATGANNTTHRFQGMLITHCSAVWPSSLPGTAVGSIPNL